MNSVNAGSSKKVTAIFVTYQPDIALLQRAATSMATQVEKLCIVDNGSRCSDEIKKLCSEHAWAFIPLGENLGIAAAYNIAFKWAESQGYCWVVTCDQDSVMPGGMISAYYAAAANLSGSESLGIICPNFVNRSTGRQEYNIDAPTVVEKCISSGSMTNVAAWKMVGGFDEAMFIDGVDFDFCKRLRKVGYGILLVPHICIEHEIGNATMHKILGHEFLVLNHSAFRKYYIAQNIIYMSGKYHSGRIEFIAYLKVFKQLLLVLLYEDDKWEKLASIIHGAMHGRKMLLGTE